MGPAQKLVHSKIGDQGLRAAVSSAPCLLLTLAASDLPLLRLPAARCHTLSAA